MIANAFFRGFQADLFMDLYGGARYKRKPNAHLSVSARRTRFLLVKALSERREFIQSKRESDKKCPDLPDTG